MSQQQQQHQQLHVTESISDRRKARELASARQSGAAAPEIDTKTGAMINPHNPEFITKRPWYLGGGDAPSGSAPTGAGGVPTGGDNVGASLDHQSSQKLEHDRTGISLISSDAILLQSREKFSSLVAKNRFQVGMWIEALKNGKRPYRTCQIIKIAEKGTIFDLRYDDDDDNGSSQNSHVNMKIRKPNNITPVGRGNNATHKISGNNATGTIERNIYFPKRKRGKENARIRHSSSSSLKGGGARSHTVNHVLHGKETYDSKRDGWHGYDVNDGKHSKDVERRFERRDEMRRAKRRKLLEDQELELEKSGLEVDDEEEGGENNNDEKENKVSGGTMTTTRGGGGKATRKQTNTKQKLKRKPPPPPKTATPILIPIPILIPTSIPITQTRTPKMNSYNAIPKQKVLLPVSHVKVESVDNK